MEGHRFLDSDFPGPDEPHFEALGTQGSGTYAGLEVFDNPGLANVTYKSDEVVSMCPITGQPDFYTCEISLMDPPKCIESKSLKLWFQDLMVNSVTKKGAFCESLAVLIRETVCEVTGMEAEQVQVVLTQKPRGGISIRSVA